MAKRDEEVELHIGCRAIGKALGVEDDIQAQRFAQNVIDEGELKCAFKYNGRWCARRVALREELKEKEAQARAEREAAR